MSKNFELLHRAEREVEEQQAAKFHEVRSAAAPYHGELIEPPTTVAGHSTREAIGKLIRKLFLVQDGCKVVVFTGLERGVGCTWLMAHAAQLLAAQDRGSVCMMDANLRSPGLHHFFQVPNHHGLSDAVVSSAPLEGFLRQLPGPNLWLLSCGSNENTERALMASDSLQKRVLQLSAQFAFVLVDSPAINLYSDALTLGASSNGIVLVLKANASRRDTAQKVVEETKAANVRVLGAVLNQRAFPIPKAIYDRL
jgi:Mrp family chromosome partitioning ATPase